MSELVHKEDKQFDGRWHPGGAHAETPLNAPKVAVCRQLVSRYLRLTPAFQHKVQRIANQTLDARLTYLAVHVRKTDKGCEAPENVALSTHAIAEKVKLAANKFGCDAVFLCADAQETKKEIRNALSGEIRVSMYAAILPASPEVAPHMDPEIPSVRKAEDMVVELMLMSRFCQALISTRSNVSTSVVVLAPPSFRHMDFWGNELDASVRPSPASASGSLGPSALVSDDPLLARIETAECDGCILCWLDTNIFCILFQRKCAASGDADPAFRSRVIVDNVAFEDGTGTDDRLATKLKHAFRDAYPGHWRTATYQGQTAVGLASNLKLRKQAAKLALAIAWTVLFKQDCATGPWPTLQDVVSRAAGLRPRGRPLAPRGSVGRSQP